MKRFLKISIPIVILLLILGGIIYWHFFAGKTTFNTVNVNGNTAGNLYNGGFFCENNGQVFFANPDDDYKLYCMDADGSHVKKLSNDRVKYINADANYIYYVKDNSAATKAGFSFEDFFAVNQNALCRNSRNGGDEVILDTDPCLYASLNGNYIYYLHYDEEEATRLYRIRIDGKEKEKISDKAILTCNSVGAYYYYSDPDNRQLYQLDTESNKVKDIYQNPVYMPIVISANNGYFLDINNNNALVHTDLTSNYTTTITTDSIDLYNVYGSFIYYQKYSETDGNSLCMIKNDGSQAAELAQGDYCSINVTSYYIYFTDYKTGQVYRTSTSNPGQLESFNPGVDTSF